jgi:hypothetical protein
VLVERDVANSLEKVDLLLLDAIDLRRASAPG